MTADRIEIGADIPRRHYPFLSKLGRLVLRSAGWHLDIVVPNEPKMVLIAAPHTSNWDFVLGLAAVLMLGLDVHWFGKHTIFKGPWGRWFRALGGIPIDRRAAGGIVAQTASAFAHEQRLLIGIAPEGTRSRVSQWRRGFYHVANTAGVPVLCTYFDYERKCIGSGPLMHPTGDWDADMKPVFTFYRTIKPKYPELFATE